MTNEQKSVLEFHRTFGALVNDRPTMISRFEKSLRYNLIFEELVEYWTALSLEDTADALGDLLYVLLGTAVAHGIDLEPVFAEVHRSNMSKLWSEEEIKAKMLDGTKGWSYEAKGDGKFIVKSDSGKVLKPPSYSPADIKTVLERQMNGRTNTAD